MYATVSYIIIVYLLLQSLRLTNDDDWVNHPISCHSTRTPVVCSFVAEPEYTGLYAATRIATEKRKLLANMGHPQPATPLFCDNEAAIGIAADTVLAADVQGH
jgi:hypothetical protein